MVKRVIFWGVIIAVGFLLFCLNQIRYDLSLKEDNTSAIEIVDNVG